MRPYIAIIKDSFREAFATRTLWFTLIAITLFLLVLLPFNFAEVLATKLRDGEITNWPGLLEELRTAGQSSTISPAKHIWSLMSEKQQTGVDEYLDQANDNQGPGPGPGGRRMRQQHRLLEELNGLLAKDNFYEATAWEKIEVPDEVKSAASATSNKERQQAAHRRLLAAAFPRHVELIGDGAVFAQYFWWRLEEPLPITPEELADVIKSVLAVLVSWVFSSVGVGMAILVTATIIPRTFEPGEITLLLSKPVSRSLLFLARFAGGCAFTLVNVAYLLVGLWLIVGLRFSIWNHQLLLGIPVYLFLFAIYFSVSALIGVRWGNAILAICLTLGFSCFLFGLYYTKGIVESVAFDPQKINSIVTAGDDVMTVNAVGETHVWNAGQADWLLIFEDPGQNGPGFQRRMLLADSHFMPRYDSAQDRIVAMKPSGSWFSNEVIEGDREANWLPQSLGRTPDSITELLISPQGHLICVGTAGIYDFVPATAADLERQEILEAASGGLWKPAAKTGTRNLHADGFERVRREDAVAMQPVTGDLFIYRAGTVSQYVVQPDGSYAAAINVSLGLTAEEAQIKRSAVMAAAKQLVVCFDNGTVQVAGAEPKTYTAFEHQVPRNCVTSSDGRYVAVLSHEGRLWLYDCEQAAPVPVRVPGQGKLSAVAFSATGELLLADHYTRVRTVDLATGQILKTYAPPEDWLSRAYHWGLAPLYWLLPKPSELNTVVAYLMTEKKSEVVTMGQQAGTNLQQERVTVDVWTPIWSSLAFITVMLALSCWHISSRDF